MVVMEKRSRQAAYCVPAAACSGAAISRPSGPRSTCLPGSLRRALPGLYERMAAVTAVGREVVEERWVGGKVVWLRVRRKTQQRAEVGPVSLELRSNRLRDTYKGLVNMMPTTIQRRVREVLL
jgi:hypothetical protein